MKSDKVKQVVIPAVALLLICLITTALLGFTDKLTREPIARENALTAQRSREEVCPAAADFEQIDIDLQGTNAEVHRALDSDGNTVGFYLYRIILLSDSDFQIHAFVQDSHDLYGTLGNRPIENDVFARSVSV